MLHIFWTKKNDAVLSDQIIFLLDNPLFQMKLVDYFPFSNAFRCSLGTKNIQCHICLSLTDNIQIVHNFS